MAYPISSDGIIIPDDATGILFYKDGQFVDFSINSTYARTVPDDEYDHMFVVSNGIAEETLVDNGGELLGSTCDRGSGRRRDQGIDHRSRV